MKNMMVLSAFLFSSALLAGEASLRLPINNEEGPSIAEVNQKLKKKGKAQLPEVFELSTKEMVNSYKIYNELNNKVVKAFASVGEDFNWYYDNVPNTDKKGTCYTGDATRVADLVFSLTDMVFSDQLNLWGWKYKKQTFINSEYNEDSAETAKYLNDESKLWKEWRGNGEAVLLLTAYSDGGEDVNESIIPRCQY